MSKEYDYLIVGAGLSGSVFAHEAKKRGYKCLVIDKRTNVGGNTYCEKINGINVHMYGAHIFHTDNKKVWEYVNRFVEFNSYVNSPIAKINGKAYNLPFNMNTFYQMWGVTTPELALARIEEQKREAVNWMKDKGITVPRNLEEQALTLIGRDMYETLVKGYTEKQWGRKCTELPAFIIRRIPVRFTFDNNYFTDRYQGIPIGGYNVLINALLSDVDVRTGIDYIANRGELDLIADKIFYSGSIDEFFDYNAGRLEYRSLHFQHNFVECSNFQGNSVVNYTDANVPYTRSIEHKHFEFGLQSGTMITLEYPCEYKNGNEPYYPINDHANNKIYEKYKTMSECYRSVIFSGRLAEYKYYDMDDVIENVLKLWK